MTNTQTDWTTYKQVRVGDRVKTALSISEDGRAHEWLWPNRQYAEASDHPWRTLISIERSERFPGGPLRPAYVLKDADGNVCVLVNPGPMKVLVERASKEDNES